MNLGVFKEINFFDGDEILDSERSYECIDVGAWRRSTFKIPSSFPKRSEK